MPVDLVFSRPLDSYVRCLEKIWVRDLESHIAKTWASLVAQLVENPLAMQETSV